MNKLYIIFTVDIHPIGGNQSFTAGMADYLESNGWQVVILFPGYSLGKCAISRLDNYLNGGHPFLGNEFPNLLSEMELDDRFNRVIKRMDYLLADYNVIYIASQNQKLALWAEFFAKKLSAKHLCFFTTEEYRGPNTYFEEYMDFYKYKFMRNELFALNVKKLFEGYINIDNPDLYKPSFIEIEAV